MALKVSVAWKGRNLPKEWKDFSGALEPYMEQAHRKSVMALVAEAVAWSRVDTGRMRSGWLPFLIQNNYAYMQLLGTASKDYEPMILAQGTFVDMPFHTVVTNNVQYTQYVEQKVGVFDTAGQSSHMRAPVATLEEAAERWSDLYARNMQKLVDNATSSWNQGRRSWANFQPEDPPPPGVEG